MEKKNYKIWFLKIIEKCYLMPWKCKPERRKRRNKKSKSCDKCCKKTSKKAKNNKHHNLNQKMKMLNKTNTTKWTLNSLFNNWKTITTCFWNMILTKNNFISNLKWEENWSIRKNKFRKQIKSPSTAMESCSSKKGNELEILNMIKKIIKPIIKKFLNNLSTLKRKIKVILW